MKLRVAVVLSFLLYFAKFIWSKDKEVNPDSDNHNWQYSAYDNYFTDYCRSDCFDTRDDAYYCQDILYMRGSCCKKEKVNEKYVACFEDDLDTIKCSLNVENDRMRYAYCFQNETICGERDRILDSTILNFITPIDFYYKNSTPCFYKIYMENTTQIMDHN